MASLRRLNLYWIDAGGRASTAFFDVLIVLNSENYGIERLLIRELIRVLFVQQKGFRFFNHMRFSSYACHRLHNNVFFCQTNSFWSQQEHISLGSTWRQIHSVWAGVHWFTNALQNIVNRTHSSSFIMLEVHSNDTVNDQANNKHVFHCKFITCCQIDSIFYNLQ